MAIRKLNTFEHVEEGRVSMFKELLEDNWFLQEIRDEARKKALEEGRKEGLEEERRRIVQGLRQTLLHYMESQFVDLIPLTKQQSELITNPEVIQNLMMSLFDARGVEEARQILLQTGTDHHQN